MPLIEIPGFRQYNSSTNSRAVNQLDLTEMLNMVWNTFGPETREGSTLNKDDSQSNWGEPAIIRTFHRRGNSYLAVIVILTSGRVFYINSNDPTYGTVGAVFTELKSPFSTTPALAANASQYDIFGFNNIAYFADSTNGYFSWDGSASSLTARTDPPGLGANNIIKLLDKSNRLLALDDAGLTHLSVINDGTNFTLISGGGSLNYGRVEGLVATGVTPYQDDVIISTEDRVSKKFQAYFLTGIQFFDPTVTGSDTSQFEVRKINSIAGIVGNSAQEIAGDTIGLTPRGFVSLSKALGAKDEISKSTDFISYPIKEIISQINFAQTNHISSAVDAEKGRYYCAVPFGKDTTYANIILVYDFLRSDPLEGIYRWSIWTFASIEDIATIAIIAGELYAGDPEGNIFKLDDSNASNADYDASNIAQPINYVIKTAGLGGANPGTEKYFGNINFLLTKLAEPFYLNVNQIIDGILVDRSLDGIPISPIKIDLPLGGLEYDTTGILYDDFHYYDSAGSDQRSVTLINKGGRAQAMQWIFSTNTTGVSWGLGNFSVNIDIVEEANQGGANNGNI